MTRQAINVGLEVGRGNLSNEIRKIKEQKKLIIIKSKYVQNQFQFS